MLKNFKELNVWQKAYNLCLMIYKITKAFPKEEVYGLVSQLRRVSVSIPSNIAEGYGRNTTADYIRFLYIAYGSICELDTQVQLSGDLGFIDKDALMNIVDAVAEVERMLKGLISSLEKKHSNP
jgi:four helix bundle protein